MREIEISKVTETVKRLCIEACVYLNPDMESALEQAYVLEESPIGKEVIKQLLKNKDIAQETGLPLCQDTGMTIVFVKIGQDAHLVGGSLEEAINEGVRQGYKEGYLRKSVCHPLTRENTGDNTPAVIHYEIVPGDKLEIIVMPKGAGSENKCKATVLTPAQGLEGIESFVCHTVEEAAVNTCSPLIVGVGIGGTLDKCVYLSKKAILREVGKRHPDPQLADLEERWLKMVNNLGYGPLGLGGRMTCLTVNIEIFPCHIASLPVAVNIQCHAHRVKRAVL